MLEQIIDRFVDNLARVENLLRLYEEAHGRGRGRRSVPATDILRAATVLLHASLEDLLRSLARWRLPLAAAEALDRIPLAGSPGRAEKFTLGAVAKHRGKTVDDLIAESINEFLDRSNYGNTVEVATFLQSLGVQVQNVNGRFADLEDLMQRRHLIVHQADRNPERGRGRHRARHITVHNVRTWITAVRAFGTALENEIAALP